MSLAILGRDAWGARPPKWNPGTANPSNGVFIHYNGAPVAGDVLAGDRESVALFLRQIQGFHMNTRGWPDIAYSFCVDAQGRCWELRGWNVAGAHTMDWNWKSHAIFLPLGGDQAPTEAQMATCRAVIAEHDRRYGKGFVRGHQEVNQTSCPGGPTMSLIRAGRFNPSSGDVFVPPSPPGVDVTVNKPVMMRDPRNGKVWLFYSNSPWRMHVKTPEHVRTYQFFGVEYKDLDAKQAAFFIANTKAVRGG